MARTKLGLLGLCAVVFGLMAFNAVPAQAETGAQWLFAEKGEGTKLIAFLEASVGLEAETTGVLHTKILSTEVLFLCKKIEAIGAVLKANGGIGEGAKIKFSECETDLGGKPSEACLPTDKVGGPGTIITAPGHGLIVLKVLKDAEGKEIGKDELVSILPDNVEGKASEVFATIEMGKACSIGSKVPVIGKAVLKDCQGMFLTHLVKHLVEVGSKAEGTELWTISKTVEHEAFILGSAFGFLIGAHVGLKVSGDPA